MAKLLKVTKEEVGQCTLCGTSIKYEFWFDDGEIAGHVCAAKHGYKTGFKKAQSIQNIVNYRYTYKVYRVDREANRRVPISRLTETGLTWSDVCAMGLDISAIDLPSFAGGGAWGWGDAYTNHYRTIEREW